MHAVFAVQLRVKFLFAANLLRVEEHCGTPRSGQNAAKVFNDNHDGRLLIYLSFCQIMLLALLDLAEQSYCKTMDRRGFRRGNRARQQVKTIG